MKHFCVSWASAGPLFRGAMKMVLIYEKKCRSAKLEGNLGGVFWEPGVVCGCQRMNHGSDVSNRRVVLLGFAPESRPDCRIWTLCPWQLPMGRISVAEVCGDNGGMGGGEKSVHGDVYPADNTILSTCSVGPSATLSS